LCNTEVVGNYDGNHRTKQSSATEFLARAGIRAGVHLGPARFQASRGVDGQPGVASAQTVLPRAQRAVELGNRERRESENPGSRVGTLYPLITWGT
jgi:hypothetical protein